eukprot:13281106-Alexandrium_andersonii.AAC.1
MSASLVGSEMCIRDRRTKRAGSSSPVYSSYTGWEATNLDRPSGSRVTDALTTEGPARIVTESGEPPPRASVGATLAKPNSP